MSPEILQERKFSLQTTYIIRGHSRMTFNLRQSVDPSDSAINYVSVNYLVARFRMAGLFLK